MFTVQEIFGTDHPVAWVTGSASPRVGRVIAGRLRALGCHLVYHARTADGMREAPLTDLVSPATEAIAVHGAVEDESAIKRMCAEIMSRFGRIDIVVNSAAIWSPKSFEQVTADDVRGYLESNTLGTFLVAQAAGLQMVQQSHGGAIINIGDWAIVRPYLDHAAYFPSKGAIPTLTRSLAVELGTRNPHIRVNAILPGPVLLNDGDTQERRQALEKSTLVKRVGAPEHVAHAVEFLVTNSFVTGISLPVDGGRQIFADEPTQTELRCG